MHKTAMKLRQGRLGAVPGPAPAGSQDGSVVPGHAGRDGQKTVV